jgi:cobalt-zinc-cadmium efflux system outer membrane protein
MKTFRLITLLMVFALHLVVDARAQQSIPGNMPGISSGNQQTGTKPHDISGMQMNSPDEAASSSNFLPQIGQSATEPSGPEYRLADMQARALQQNPTLSESQAKVRSAQGRKLQAGLWPNPTVGYLGDEIAGGTGINGGRQGGFVEQTIVLGRKLYLAQQVAGSDAKIAELEKEEQHYRVQNAIRSAYVETLAGQELLALAYQYVKLSDATLETAQRLRNIGARDESEVAMAEIEVERAKLSAEVQRAQLQQNWENLRSLIGGPELPIGHLDGNLDADLPQLDSQELLNTLIAESPAMKVMRENATRAETSVLASRRQSVPDLRVRAGVEQNLETNDLTGKPFGLEGFAELRVELPIFNRNQGNVDSARAEMESSQAETHRVELQLRQQAGIAVEQYQAARITVERYQTEILPRLQRLYEMQRKAWGRMALSYPQVLLVQQNLFTAEAQYIHALRDLKTSAVALSGFLLTDGLAAPGGSAEGR